MKNEFLVLVNKDGDYLPNVFIHRNDEFGQEATTRIKNMEEGDKIVVVKLVEI
jgi:hypothetical protein